MVWTTGDDWGDERYSLVVLSLFHVKFTVMSDFCMQGFGEMGRGWASRRRLEVPPGREGAESSGRSFGVP